MGLRAIGWAGPFLLERQNQCGIFLLCQSQNVTPEIAAKNPHAGDTWTFTGIDTHSKLIPCWLTRRDACVPE